MAHRIHFYRRRPLHDPSAVQGRPAMTTVRALILLGAVELAALAALGWIPAAHRFPLPGLAVFAVAFAAYGLAGWLLATGSDRGVETGTKAQAIDGLPDRDSAGSDARGRQARRTLWLMAIAMRLVLLPLTPVLSDDVYRYLWDGHVQLSGVNPYLHAPSAPEVEALRTPFHEEINNPDVPTIYPPLAQLAFVLVALGGSSILAAKLLWMACDLGTAWVLTRVARRTGRDEGPVLLLYLWAPLLVVEVAWSGHLEPLGLLFMALAILWGGRASGGQDSSMGENAVPDDGVGGKAAPPEVRRGLASATKAGAALALSALTKLAPAAALPALVHRHGWRALATFIGTVALLYLPYASAGEALFTGARTYGEHWWFMKGAFALLELVASDPLHARLLAGAGVAGVVAWTVARRMDPERALLWILGAGMILTPTLHPWYVLWMLPMAALRRSPAWIALGGLAFIGYFGLTGYQETGVWAQPFPVRAALWVPFFILLAWEGRGTLTGKALTEGR